MLGTTLLCARAAGLSMIGAATTLAQHGVPDTELVDWVCRQAAANRSASRCKPCEWFELQDLAPADTSLLPPPRCSYAKLAWFMCLTPGTDALAMKHLQYVQSAIVSARFNAPTLAPHVILVSKVASQPASRLYKQLSPGSPRFSGC